MIRIPIHSTIIGELRCDGATRVDGRIEGEGNINGILLLSKTCVWVGKVTADKIIVEGIFEGHIIARKKLQIAANAKVTGKISAPEMLVAPGAILNCAVDVSKVSIPVGLIKPVAEPETELTQFDELAERRNPAKRTA